MHPFQGIQDKLLLEKTYPNHHSCSREEVQQIDELKLTCILNLSMCFWKSNDWANCIRACNRALQMDPQNTKALYRRAQARIIPAYCGMTENLQALEDLKKAVSLKPDDSLLTTAYAELKISLSEQKKKDKKTFSNLFDRKDSSTDSMDALGSETDQLKSNGGGAGGSSSSSKAADNKNLTWQDAFNMVKDMESAAARCDRDGLTAQAAAIRAKKDELQAQMMVYFPAHLQKPFPELMAAAQLKSSGSSNASVSTSSSSGAGAGAGFRSVSTDSISSDVPVTAPGGSKKKGKSKNTTTTATATGSSSATSTTCAVDNTSLSTTIASKATGSAKPSSSARSKVTTAAGGELSGAWFDAYGNDYDLVDFSKPTEEMIRDAQSRGLDLTDVRLVLFFSSFFSCVILFVCGYSCVLYLVLLLVCTTWTLKSTHHHSDQSPNEVCSF